MDEQKLRRLVDRLDADPSFRVTVQERPGAALDLLDLPPAHRRALEAHDEDAFRRLAADAGGEQARIWTWVKKTASRLFGCKKRGPSTRSWECPQPHG